MLHRPHFIIPENGVYWFVSQRKVHLAGNKLIIFHYWKIDKSSKVCGGEFGEEQTIVFLVWGPSKEAQMHDYSTSSGMGSSPRGWCGSHPRFVWFIFYHIPSEIVIFRNQTYSF